MRRPQRRKKAVFEIDDERSEVVSQIKFYVWKKKWDTALVLIEDYLKDNPTDFYIVIYKAIVLTKLSKTEEAKEIYLKVLEKKLTKRNQIFAYIQYAQLLSQSEEIDKAIEYYEKAVQLSDSLELVARGKLSYFYCYKKEYQKAFDILNIPGYNSTFLNIKRAGVYSAQKKYYQAIKEVDRKTHNDYDYEERELLDDRALEQDKNFVVGYAYYKLGKFNEALKYLTKATYRINKTFFEANSRICKINMMQGNVNEAITLATQVLKENPSKHYIRLFKNLMADAYLRKGDYERAQKIYVTIDTNDGKKNINLGKVELTKGNFEKAEEYFSEFDINSEDVTEKYEDFLKLAFIKFRLKKYDELDEILNKFKNSDLTYELNRLMYEVRRLEIYSKRERGIDIQIDENELSYSEKQMLSYSEEVAIEHIKDHHMDNPTISKFYDNVDIDNLFYEIKGMLKEENIIYDSVFDKYVINYKKIGVDVNNGNIHQLRVLTLPNTKDIITMYPFDGTENLLCMEDTDEKVKDKPKVKRLSQIEKFNMRYGKN